MTKTKKDVFLTGLAIPVMIVVLALTGSQRVKANDQPSAAPAAVKIDNFVFGPQSITVPVGMTCPLLPFTG